MTTPLTIGSYRILRAIGEGGMGMVYLAEHVTLGRRAAIKVLQPALSARSDVVHRFFNEARAATAIPDPGIVQVFDFGRDPQGAYIVMELLDGEPLDARLERRGRLAPDEAMRIVRQVASTLGAAHRCGIVHRDLKPENIFLVRDPEVASGERAKILDFGIAKLASDDTAAARTQLGTIMGTPAYMSPEQCRGTGEIDARSDIYSLGCVLFHLLTGTPPFTGEGMGDVIAKHLREAPPAPSQYVPGIPAALDAHVLRCLRKAPGERPSTMADVVSELDVLRKVSVPPAPASAMVSMTMVARAGAPTTLSSAAGTRQGLPPRSRARVAIACLLGCGALAGLVAATSWRGREPAAVSTHDAAVPYDASPVDAWTDVLDAPPSDAPADATVPDAPPDAGRGRRPSSRPHKPAPPPRDPCDLDGDGIPEIRC